MNNKRLIIPTIALGVIITAGVAGLGIARANDSDGYPPIVERLAEQFGLQEEEVEAVFDSVRDERHEVMQTSMEEKLNQAVSDGVLTEEQKQALIDKKGEMKAHRGEHKEEMQAWFEEQGIDHEALMQYGGFKHHRFGDWDGKK